MDALINPAMSPVMNSAANPAEVDIQSQRRSMESLGRQKLTPEQERAKMRNACEGFEALFIQKMWDEMRSSLPKDGMMHSKEEEQWQAMYSQELGKSMAKSGGIGLADMMMVQLTKNRDDLADASAKAAPRRVGMDVPPVPLLPPALREKDAPAAKAAPVTPGEAQSKPAGPFHDLYEGEAAAVQPQDEAASTAGEAPAAMTTQTEAAEDSGDSSSLLRQTLDDLRADLRAQGQPVPGELPAQPVVQTFTYTTNLPPSQRQGMEKILAAAAPTRQPARVENTALNAPAPSAYSASQPAPGAQAGLRNTAVSSEAATNETEVKPEAPATPLPPGVPSPQNDILAGITVSYRPESGNLNRQSAPATLLAERAQSSPLWENAPLVGEVREASLSAAAGPAAMPTFDDSRLRPLTPSSASPAASPVSGTLLAMKMPGEEAAAPAAQEAVSPLTSRLKPVRAGGPALSSPLSAPEQRHIAAADLGRLNLAANSVHPPVAGEISSGFGWRIDPLSGQRAWHNGVDIKAEAGSSVRASLPGTVSFAGQDPELGNLIIVDHPGGLQSYYGHNEKILVQAGDSVNEGTEIANAGSSGRASGTHVHFELRRNNLPLNPEPVLAQGAARPATLNAAAGNTAEASKGASHVSANSRQS